MPLQDKISAGRLLSELGAGVLATDLLLWAAGSLGPTGALLNLVVLLPAAFLFMRRGAGAGCCVVLATVAVLSATDGAAGVLAYLLQFGLASLTLPLLLRRNWSWDRAVGGTLLLLLGIGFLALGTYGASEGVSLGELVGRYVDREVQAAMTIYQEAELPQEQIEELGGMVEQMADYLRRAWPALAAVATGGVLLVNVLLLAALARGRYRIPGEPFHRWKAPEWTVWLLIAGGFGMLYADGLAGQAAVNLLTLVLPLYFLQGMAVVTHYFRKREIPTFFRGLGYLLMTVLNPLPLMVVAVGVFDLWADFRRPKIKKKES